jgi:hypothetical protein
MADELRKGAGALARAIPENAGHRDFEIVIQNRDWHAAKKGKRRDVPVEKGFGIDFGAISSMTRLPDYAARSIV